MDYVPKQCILEYPPNTLNSIRKFCGLDNPKILDESISALQEWVNKQDHFVRKDFDKKHLEWTLVASKGSIERAKERLDKYCTGRILHKRIFENLDMDSELKNLNDYHLVILPKFSDNFYRVVISKMCKLPKSSSVILSMFRYGTMLLEYMRDHDYINGGILILDYLDVDIVEHTRTLNVTDVRQFIAVSVDCLGIRVKGIHMITTSNMVEVLVSIIKPALSPKIRERIFVHKNYESLYDYIPKDILPVNYGGKEKPLSELDDMWRSVLTSKEHIEYLKKMEEFRTDESRRQLVDFNNQYMGTAGSFRSFVVD